MKIYKFMVPTLPATDGPSLGRLCIVIASDVNEAKQRAEAHAQRTGFDAGWLNGCDIGVFEPDVGTVLCWAEVN